MLKSKLLLSCTSLALLVLASLLIFGVFFAPHPAHAATNPAAGKHWIAAHNAESFPGLTCVQWNHGSTEDDSTAKSATIQTTSTSVPALIDINGNNAVAVDSLHYFFKGTNGTASGTTCSGTTLVTEATQAPGDDGLTYWHMYL
jgi:hypothetical protein